MIFMGTQWIPHNKAEEFSKIFIKVINIPIPSCIKKWQTFSSGDGENGMKGVNIIYSEKGKGDEALIEITKIIAPFWEIEGYRWKLEPLMSVSDSMKVMG